MSKENVVNDAVKSGGSYEIIRSRLEEQGKNLFAKVENLNKMRSAEFGGSKSDILSKIKIRTNNNCLPIDMAQVNGQLLVGYQVNLGLKSVPAIEDVFYLYDVKEENGEYNLVESNFSESFFNDPKFIEDFNNLMTYYKDNQLVQISRVQNSLYISFKIGSTAKDLMVFKFVIANDKVVYQNNMASGEFGNTKTHCFDWIQTTRKDHVEGAEPHVSIIDKVFVETIKGDLTIKIENNTDGGGVIYSEPVENEMQVLEDAKIFYAVVNDLIMLNIKPYNEDERYFIFNTVTEEVVRADSIGRACIELPENHGVVFPDGYYLANGEHKFFEKESDNSQYFSTVSAPNGEDYMYVFFDAIENCYVLYFYNLINKSIENPIHAHGYSVFENGKVMVFRHSDNMNASKIHPLTIWKTPFYGDEFFSDIEKARALEDRDRFLTNIGNAELVRAISDLFDVVNFIKKDEVSTSLYEGIIRASQKNIDNYHWIKDAKTGEISKTLLEIIDTSDLIVDEFEKVKSIQKQSLETLTSTQKTHNTLVKDIKVTSPDKSAGFVVLLGDINKHIGHLLSIKNERYIDVTAIDKMKVEIEDQKEYVNKKLLTLLQDKRSFNEYFTSIEKIEQKMDDVTKVVEIEPLEKSLAEVNFNVSTINNEVNNIEVSDSTITSMILDYVSEVFSKLNKVNAQLKNLKKSFLSKEAKNEFAAQFKLLSQSVSNGISRADTPDNCDSELSALISQVEKLESKFADFDEYLEEIYTKRDDINSTFEGHKQQLINNLQKRIGNIVKAAKINLKSISKKVEGFDSVDELNTYFSSDAMVLKVNRLIENIRDIGGDVQAEELDSELTKIKDMSMRSLRDNKDIFKDGGKIMVMGKHEFAVNHSPLDLTILNQDGKMVSHLTSTDYYQTVQNTQFDELSHLWNSEIPSESNDVYRAEYLAYLVLNDAINNKNELNLEALRIAIKESKLINIINSYASSRYKDSYIKGVHDYDAELFLKPLVAAYLGAGDMTLPQKSRSYAVAIYKSLTEETIKDLTVKVKNANSLKIMLNNSDAWSTLKTNFFTKNENLFSSLEASEKDDTVDALFNYILNQKFEASNRSFELENLFKMFLNRKSISVYNNNDWVSYFEDIVLWVTSFVQLEKKEELKDFIYEAAAVHMMSTEDQNHIAKKDIDLKVNIEGLLGEHRTVNDGMKSLTLDNFLSRLKYHHEVFYSSFEAFIELRKKVSEDEKEKLCLEDFKSKPLTSFVRNKLITEAYLPMIGDNFAKQMGTVGDTKRSDLMGLLLLISPPGYGKTTLIEYVANKLGLVFVKVNCPSIGHSVTSLDPSEASDSTSQKEINKINLAFEMGSNVLLYLDDIQHTNPEFLQKFISLCDGTRRVEGVWEGKTKTYDMRGKRFSVVMAGNPYTETGETFQIPDMLANRADIYNLGDILGGKVDTFKLSYIENSLTSNRVLAPLATRTMEDVYRFVKMAKGDNVPLDEFDFNYSSAEANEIVSVLKHMTTILEVVFSVNMEYIKSAATNDKYRVEPAFKLQGSYRNMNKMTEKLVAVMNDDEIEHLIVDHYTGESQTLTTGAESNMLKLKNLMKIMKPEETERWTMICEEFNKSRKMGGDDADSVQKIAMQLSELTNIIEKMSNKDTSSNSVHQGIDLEQLEAILNKIQTVKPEVNDSMEIDKLDILIDKIKENQSEDKLIELFSKRIEDMQDNFIKIISEKDRQFVDTFTPMIDYFAAVLKKHEQKDLESKNKKDVK